MDEGTKRKIVYPNDLLRYHEVWDAQLRNVFGLIPHLHQPLRPLIPESTWNTVLQITEGRKKMDSILVNYYGG